VTLVTETLLIYLGLAFYLIAALLSIRHFAAGRSTPALGRSIVLAGALLHAGAIILRARDGGPFPAQNLHEFALLAFTLTMLAVLAIDLAKNTPSLLYGAAPVAAIGIPLAGLLTRTGPEAGAPPPASVWTALHVIATTAGFACFLIAFVSDVMYLAAQRELKTKTERAVNSRLPPLETALRVHSGAVLTGFLLLTAGILLGYFYARAEPPTRGWRIDPKVILTTVTWLCYGIVLALAVLPRWRGRRSVIASMISFGSVLLTLCASLAWTQFHQYP
jgi:ABC-type uncharacterized transport system permease subunit